MQQELDTDHSAGYKEETSTNWSQNPTTQNKLIQINGNNDASAHNTPIQINGNNDEQRT